MSEEVIELSVEETNKLRAELGLAPLRLSSKEEESSSPMMDDQNNGDQEILQMSVDETNQLREKLGLPPLRNDSSSTRQAVQDAGLKEKQQQEELAREEERDRLQEDVQKGIQSTFTEQSLGGMDESYNAKSWAEKFRITGSSQTTAGADSEAATKSSKKKKTKKIKKEKSDSSNGNDKYDENDLKGMNVAHSMAELEAGSTTVMTLADAPLLATDDNNAHLVRGLNEDADTPQLENVNLSEQAKQSDGLKKKRQLEMGMGRAGGYAGFDDDEFMELGGTGAPSRMARGGDGGAQRKAARQGFTIGDMGSEREQKDASDLFAAASGKAVSLEPSQADVQASDFMTEQEQEEEELKTTKSKKKEKFDKKKKKKDKKEKKKHRRRQPVDEEDESEDDTQVKKPINNKPSSSSKTFLDELEETAGDSGAPKKSRQRNRFDDDGNDEDEEMEETPTSVPSNTKLAKSDSSNGKKSEDKRAKYEAIMAKGNERTQKAFSNKRQQVDEDLDDEPDDAFLDAALAKARRLKRLREMSGAKGAEAVAQAVQSLPDAPVSSSNTQGGMTFSVDDTREFTRALKARSEQQVRKQTKDATKKKDAPANTITTVKKEQEPKVETVKQEDEAEEDADMEELAKEVKEDETDYLEGTTGSTVSVGRGLAGVMNLFKQTGDFTRKNAGKEELRGRAKDERTYEDYEKLDLNKVVKMDQNYSNDKDREFASREVKLEYRDKHGRLLTRKEAFRDLCYQFHGHGSGKRKDEKRQKQMEREQAEARMASQQLAGADGGPGMLGALKATQKATGKAFVVHKT